MKENYCLLAVRVMRYVEELFGIVGLFKQGHEALRTMVARNQCLRE